MDTDMWGFAKGLGRWNVIPESRDQKQRNPKTEIRTSNSEIEAISL
jgi:hypothetical protein